MISDNVNELLGRLQGPPEVKLEIIKAVKWLEKEAERLHEKINEPK